MLLFCFSRLFTQTVILKALQATDGVVEIILQLKKAQETPRMSTARAEISLQERKAAEH